MKTESKTIKNIVIDIQTNKQTEKWKDRKRKTDEYKDIEIERNTNRKTEK
jgi:hypothetical protein